MTRALRRFYTRYYLLTLLAPAYLNALALYLLLTVGHARLGAAQPLQWLWLPVWAAACLWGTGLLGRLGLVASGLQRRGVTPGLADEAKLRELGALCGPAAVKLTPRLFELGEVPFVAVVRGMPPELQLSTYSLRREPPERLRYVVAHEAAHLEQRPALGAVWRGLLWLASAWVLLLAILPWEVAVGATAVHAWVWLRLDYALRQAEERRADRVAAAATDRPGYIEALAGHLRQFDGARPDSVLRRRLKALGLSAAEVERLAGEAR